MLHERNLDGFASWKQRLCLSSRKKRVLMERLEARRSHISIYRRSGCVPQRAQEKPSLTEPSSGWEGAGTHHQGTPVTGLAAGKTEAARLRVRRVRLQPRKKKWNEGQFSQRIRDGPSIKTRRGGGSVYSRGRTCPQVSLEVPALR